MWDLIQATMGGRAVVLTTHSMEEADALCQRIAIMTNGTLQAVGTAQHLKTKFGKGYLLETKAAEDNVDKVEKFVFLHYTNALLTDSYGEMRNFSIPQGSLQLSAAFSLLEQNKAALGLLDYSLSQASLEQVFLRFAKHQIDEDSVDDVEVVLWRGQIASGHPSVTEEPAVGV